VGRPYAEEMDHLVETYDWAAVAPLGALPPAIRRAAAKPLVAVGSGGSYTTASFAAASHRHYASILATAMTPLEVVSTPQSLREVSIFLATAGGGNPDVIGAFEKLICREPKRFLVLCAREGSPLARKALKHPDVDFTEFDPPSGKDGFLATNSLLASVMLIVRAYAAAFDAPEPLPRSLSELLHAELGQAADEIHERCQLLWKRPHLVVLYGPSCHTAAIDLESKFTEAALGGVHLADFRNFAHGRHHWLAKRGQETAVLALVSDEDHRLADAMVNLLPKDIPVVQLTASGDSIQAGLAALVQVFLVVSSAGRAREIDPGKPGVPPFGRQIYRFRAFTPDDKPPDELPLEEAAAIERKTRASVATHHARGTLEQWRAYYRDFRARLAKARFRGIVLDYDGTLCRETDRFDPLPSAVGGQLNRLLHAGVILGVATGRGKSVKTTLRQAVQRRYWERVIVGYYNGGDVASLADDARPNGNEAVVSSLEPVVETLKRALAPSAAKVTLRLPQITIEPGPDAKADELWNLVQHVVFAVAVPGVTVVRSSHSMDVVAPGVSKQSVVDRVGQLVPGRGDAPILCVGDRGLWPGNDYALLGTPHSLSVDEVSPDPGSCWNLARPGRRGPPVALDYLEHLEADGEALRLVWERTQVRRPR